MTTNESDQQVLDTFRTQLEHVDEFLQLLLNSHFEIEGQLDTFLGEMFFHPEYIERARLGFAQKVHIVRAYTTDSHNRPEWPLILGLNKIRNDIAHRSRHKPLAIDIEKLRQLTANIYKRKEDIEAANYETLVVYAALICCGFLEILIDQLKRAQGKEIDDDD